MEDYIVGNIIPKFANHREEVLFDFNDNGASLFIFFNNPTKEEVAQFGANKPFEIRFTTLKDVIMITIKIGNLNWMDVPYSPHLSKHLTKFDFPMESQGLALTIMFIDAISGELKSIRLLGLSENFSKKFIGEVMDQKMREFSKQDYAEKVNEIYSSYTTKEIVKMSKDYCKMN